MTSYVEDTEDSGSDDELTTFTSTKRSTTEQGSGTMRLKEVRVPSSSFKVPPTRPSTTVRQSPSSVSSANPSLAGQSSGYDTPGTSVAVTPAESIAKGGLSSVTTMQRSGSKRGRPRKSMLAEQPKTLQVKAEVTVKAQPKRKRPTVELSDDDLSDETPDAILARRLQAEEYGSEAQKPITGRKTLVPQDDDSDNEDFMSIDESDSSAPLASFARDHKAPARARTSLPSRTARDSARKSISKRLKLEIHDSEDSELSEVDSEFFDQSDFSDDEVESASGLDDGTVAAASNSNAVAAQVSRNPVIPRAQASGRQPPNRRRGGNGRMTRVRQLLFASFAAK